jgi:site-specific recombinase
MVFLWQRFKNLIHPQLSRSDLVSSFELLSEEEELKDKILGFATLVEWLRLPFSAKETEAEVSLFHHRNVRFKFLMLFLERNPTEAQKLLKLFSQLLTRGMGIRLFSHTGLSENNFFFHELKERIFRRLFPRLGQEMDLALVIETTLNQSDDPQWLEESFSLMAEALGGLFEKHSLKLDSLTEDMKDSLIILAAQIASLGTSREIRLRHSMGLSNSPFVRPSQHLLSGHGPQEVLKDLMICRLTLSNISSSLASSGVSINLIYLIERLHLLLNRLELLLTILNEEDKTQRLKLYKELTLRVVRDEIKRTRIREFLKENLHFLTLKVVEHAGSKGDYYIADTKQERKKLLQAAGLAGVVTSFAALIKFLIGFMQAPYFLESFFYFLNYSLVFILMQVWHLALSSKLPAYTASALAGVFENFLRSKEVSVVVKEVKSLFYSQYLAAMGNLIGVIPLTIAMDFLWMAFTGEHLLSTHEAQEVLKKHSLWESGTLFYAFLTGIFLWLSSLVTGAVENWMVYNRVSDEVGSSSWFKLFTTKKSRPQLLKKLPGLVGALVGNLAIAAMLAFPILIGKITGLPLDIRHVTLSASSITFAFNSLGADLELWPSYLSMALSIVAMGVLNFGVSFYFSLKLAASAKNIDARYIKLIFRYAFSREKKNLST